MGTWRSIALSAGKSFLADNAMMLASALAYSTFFAIPSVLLVAVGVFTLAVGPGTITSFTHHLSHVMPAQAASLLDGSLKQLGAHPAQGIVLTLLGFVLAIWSLTGAMTTYMTAVNLAYGLKDERKFLRKRLVALQMVAIVGVAFVLVAVLLMFGPSVEHLVASHSGRASGVVGWVWWIAQWPILIGGLSASFAALLFLGPDRTPRRWRLVTPGAIVATVVWLAAAGLFAFYSGTFGSYNKTWGSLSAVIVMLTWLWLTGLALLYGAEVDAEVERRAAVTPRQTLAELPARLLPRSDEPRRRDRRSVPRSG